MTSTETETAEREAQIETLFAHLDDVTGRVTEHRAALDDDYAKQLEVFRSLRQLGVTNKRIADRVGVSEEAIIRRLRKKT